MYCADKNWKNLVGKKIIQVNMEDKQYLTFQTKDSSDFTFQAYGDCCSYSWIEHVSGLDALLGQEVLEFEEISMGEVQHDNKHYDCLQSYSYKLKTAKGVFEVELRNDSNGYYGGDLSPTDRHCLKELKEDF